MTIEDLQKLDIPDSPGVYTFRDSKKRPFYIGRATSLRDRVKSYFKNDLIDARGPRIVDMVTKSRYLTWQEYGSVLEAVLMESELIKRYQPYYNVDERDDKSAQYVIITDEPWPRVFLARVRDHDQALKDGTLPYDVKHKFGPYIEAGLIKEALKILRRLFPFRDKKSVDPRHEAFYRALGRSPNGNDDLARQEYLQTIKHLVLFFKGRKARLRSELKRQFRAHCKELRFEEAEKVNRLLFALDHINDMSLLKRELSKQFGSNHSYRIEAYDIAHMGGMENVGVMVVSTNGQLTNSEYRKFKISVNKSDDVASLMEVMSRRLNHSEWPYPDLIVVDGNNVQMRHAEGVLMARRVKIPVVAVTKDERHRAANILGNPEVIKKYRNEIIAINAEAHRFAIRYHRHRREGMRK